jgi:hypothetical protein
MILNGANGPLFRVGFLRVPGEDVQTVAFTEFETNMRRERQAEAQGRHRRNVRAWRTPLSGRMGRSSDKACEARAPARKKNDC